MVEAGVAKAQTLPIAATGRDVAMATLGVMQRCAGILPPMRIVEAFAKAGGVSNQTTYTKLWTKFGAKTADVMTEGALGLTMLWDSAWKEAGKTATKKVAMGAADQNKVRARYIDKTFAPSLALEDIGKVLK